MKVSFNFNNNNFKRSVTPKYKPVIIGVVIAVLLFLVIHYVIHIPFNLLLPGFYLYVAYWIVAAIVILMLCNFNSVISPNAYNKGNKILGYVAVIGIALIFVTSLLSSPIFNAKEYANRVSVEESAFDTIAEVDFNNTPIIDRISTEALGDRVMGQMPELVSQFEVSAEYTQISYKDSVYRVTPLEYADVIKYFTNREKGIPAYIVVNSTTGEAELVKLSDLGLDGMRYVPSAMFNENLERKLQFDYPGLIFGSPSFEIDEEGRPWYVCTSYTFKAVGTKRMVEGVVLFDPITGESTYYDDVLEAPKWVDRIFPESLVIEEVDNHGTLKDGYINSVFGQRNVFTTSDGYNYLEKDGDIWIYSGLTSANSDAANLGFILVNLRTHETKKITSAGADEFSAMNSAMGSVKNYGYEATFPLLVNVGGKPTYLMALKDNAGLIKMYAMVDASDYQKVATVSIDEGLDALKIKFIGENINEIDKDQLKEKTITVKDIRIVQIEGRAMAFITTSEDEKYKLEVVKENEDIVVFLKPNDQINVSYIESDVNIIKDIK